MADRVNFFTNLLRQTKQSECYQIWVTTFGHGPDVKLWRPCLSCDWKCVKMAVTQIPSKIFSKPTSQNGTEFGLQYQVSVRMLNCETHADHVIKSVSKWPTINCLENRVNSFNNLLLQAQQSECNQIWVTTLEHMPGVDFMARGEWWAWYPWILSSNPACG